MGCCCSKHEEDRFDDRSALLSKGNNTERSVRDDELLKAKLNTVGGNGHYAKPVTTAPSTKAASCCSDAGCSSTKKHQERVNPTVESVDLLGLDQPPSPPASINKGKPTAAASPVKPKSPARSSSITLPKNDFVEPVKSPVKPKTAVPESPKEALSDLMPPRPTPPPSRAASAVAAAPVAPVAPVPARVPSPPPAATALDESVDLEDGDDNDAEGDGEDEASGVASNATVSSSASTASNKSKSKKKKKKGKK